MKLRILAASTALAIATALGGSSLLAANSATPALAQTSSAMTLTTLVPCDVGGAASTCTLTVTSLQVVNGELAAAGTVTGGGVTVPFSSVPVTLSGACPITSLNLGGLHVNLIGIVVDLNLVHLNLTGQSGSVQLGGLLCAVSHVLASNAPASASAPVVSQINSILAGT